MGRKRQSIRIVRPVSYTHLDVYKRQVGIRFEMDNLFYSSDSLIGNYTSLGMNPYYMLESDDWRVRVGAHVDWQSGEDLSLIHILLRKIVEATA